MTSEETPSRVPRAAPAKPKRYRVINPDGRGGIDYPGKDGVRKRAEHGEVVDDIPSKSVSWLLRDGIIEEVSDGEVRE